MSDHLKDALQSGILIYTWRQNLERELASVLNADAMENTIIKETMKPGKIAQTFDRATKPNPTDETETQNEHNNADNEEDGQEDSIE